MSIDRMHQSYEDRLDEVRLDEHRLDEHRLDGHRLDRNQLEYEIGRNNWLDKLIDEIGSMD